MQRCFPAGEQRIGDPTEAHFRLLGRNTDLQRTVEGSIPWGFDEIPFDSSGNDDDLSYSRWQIRRGIAYTKGAPDDLAALTIWLRKEGAFHDSTQRKRIGEGCGTHEFPPSTLAAAQSEDCRGGEEGMTFLVSWNAGSRQTEAGKPWRSSAMRVTTVMITGIMWIPPGAIARQLGIADTAASVLRGENWNGR